MTNVNQTSLFMGYLGVALLAVGCGQSKEDWAVQRLQQRRDPAFIRLVNLTDSPSKLNVNGKDYGDQVEPLRTSVFLASPKGAAKIKVDGISDTIDYQLNPKTVVSFYLVNEQNKSQVKMVEGEPRNLPKGETQVTFLSTDGSRKYTVKIASGEAFQVPVFKPSPVVNIPVGDFKATVLVDDKQAMSVGFKAIDQGAYTVVIREVGGKPEVVVLNNHPDRSLSMAGASGG